MAEKIEEGKTPAGAPIPPEKDTEVIKDAPKTVKVGDKEYESSEALGEAYQNLETKLGEQGTELGDLRSANKVLTEQMESAQEAAKEKAKAGEPPATDYESKLAVIYKQLNDGDISVEDALQQSNALTAEATALKAVKQATQKFETTLQERDAESIQKDFLKANPDFAELRDSGKLEEIKKEAGGMHDDFSAYYAYKATEAFEKGKAEAARLAAGDKDTKTVLTKPGDSIKETNKSKTPLSESENEASMLKAMEGG